MEAQDWLPSSKQLVLLQAAAVAGRQTCQPRPAAEEQQILGAEDLSVEVAMLVVAETVVQGSRMSFG